MAATRSRAGSGPGFSAMSGPPDAGEFRAAMARFPTGVTVTTTVDADGRPHGFTAGSFVSVSAEPPLVSVCVSRTARCHPAFEACAAFAVNVLRHDMAGVARTFATRGADKFTEVEIGWSAAGLPVLDGALLVVECDVYARHPAGDHDILIGEVRRLCTRDGEQLLFADRAFSRLPHPGGR